MLTILRKAESVCWETWLGVDTFGVNDDHRYGGHYSTAPYGYLRKLLRALDLQPSDVVADLGCGKGRILAMARRYPVAQVIGVEANADLIPIAQRNCRGHGAPTTIIHALAQDVDYDGVTVFLMHSPFDEPTMDTVMQHVLESTQRQPRPIRLAYAHDCFRAPLLRRFRETDRWPPVAGFTHHTSFWTHQ